MAALPLEEARISESESRLPVHVRCHPDTAIPPTSRSAQICSSHVRGALGVDAAFSFLKPRELPRAPTTFHSACPLLHPQSHRRPPRCPARRTPRLHSTLCDPTLPHDA